MTAPWSTPCPYSSPTWRADDFGLQIEVPDAVQRHIAGQARLRGALADRSSAPPTPYDVVILRQLVAEGLVPRSDLAATVEAAETARYLGR